MKIHILALFTLAAFASACATNTATTPNSNTVSNTNSPANTNTATTAKNENSTAANANTKNTTSTKNEKSTSGQSSERVQFPTGKTETHLQRDVPPNGSIDFVLNARSGQRLQYSVNYDKGSDTDVEAFLTEPELQDISKTSAGNEPNEFIIKKTGDHRITVQNKTGNKMNVDLGIVIK